jgi:NADPH-dependent 2,4-dienoyl-CoA reductase/sulfur reductase-like enzyme/Fe-S-cluster-containing hydrogenase component 2/bacterioferritin-associated ferredoxin
MIQPMRLRKHPILTIPEKTPVRFTWNASPLLGYDGEMISAALIANGVHVFGHHPKDGSPQGIFCANGQCSQCLVMADGRPVKACMTPLRAGMAVGNVEGLPRLPAEDAEPRTTPVASVTTEVLIIGGGPAGLAAAIELGRLGVRTLLVDDKDRLGGKLVLQTHKFFGSVEDSYAGTRGFEIGNILAAEIARHPSVEVWLSTTAVAVFSDRVVGVVRDGRYLTIRPAKLMVATGAREKMLSFPGNTLPGVYGAGAFQTLVNRDLVKSSGRILIVGGGNVGLIAGYHAIQAGIEVVALIEALPQIGGYKVHADKLARLGVPIRTRHTILCAAGAEHVESATIAALDEKWNVRPGTEKSLAVDTVLIAVGLAEVNEFYLKAKQFGLDVFHAGDAQEIAEASAAMFTGKIEGLKIAKSLGAYSGEVPREWDDKATVLKSRPGSVTRREPPSKEEGVFPVFHCTQEVPCNPCTSVCPQHAIRTENDTITGLPYFIDKEECTGCASCVAVCPGLSVTLVDYRQDSEHPLVVLPYEVWREKVEIGRKVPVTDVDGAILGYYPVEKVKARKKYPGTLMVHIRVDRSAAKRAVGIWVQERQVEPMTVYEKAPPPDEAIVCRCERIRAGEIRAAIRSGVRDLNQLKALTRAGMGACGSKTCRPMIWRMFKEEGVDLGTVTDRVDRPLFVEVPIGAFAGVREGSYE